MKNRKLGIAVVLFPKWASLKLAPGDEQQCRYSDIQSISNAAPTSVITFVCCVLVQVIWNHLYNTASFSDKGTLKQLANLIS